MFLAGERGFQHPVERDQASAVQTTSMVAWRGQVAGRRILSAPGLPALPPERRLASQVSTTRRRNCTTVSAAA